MNKIKRLKMSREKRSEINRKNAMKAVEKRRKNGGFTHRGKAHPGIPNMPLKHVAMYTADYIVYHRYAMMTGKTKLDIMHELIAPLKDKLVGHEPDAWAQAIEQMNLPLEEY